MNYETAYKEGYGDLLQFDSGAGYKSHVELEKAEKERVGFSEVVIFTEPNTSWNHLHNSNLTVDLKNNSITYHSSKADHGK